MSECVEALARGVRAGGEGKKRERESGAELSGVCVCLVSLSVKRGGVPEGAVLDSPVFLMQITASPATHLHLSIARDTVI